MFRKSFFSKVVWASILPVRYPLPSGLNGLLCQGMAAIAGRNREKLLVAIASDAFVADGGP